MHAHRPARIARTLIEADLLGHDDTDARPSVEHLGIDFAHAGEEGVICWTGLCGDPDPGYRLVKYTDATGLCNIYRKVPC